MTILHTFENGDVIERSGKALIVRFNGQRDVLSTSALNGGFQKELKWVFNHDCKVEGLKDAPLKAHTYSKHMEIIAQLLGLDPAYTCGLSTAADMENAAIETAAYSDLSVTAAVTGGIDVNGGRVGDPAGWHELGGESVRADGTINIFLYISSHLSEGALTRALVTCTEAKTAALQELLAPSLYSAGIATGSGTDGTVVICDPQSPLKLTYAGKHSKLGELIGCTIMKAVKRALFLQTGLGPEQQFDIFRRLGRYGVTRKRLLEESPGIDKNRLNELSKRSDFVTLTSLYVHLLDQHEWGLLSNQDALSAAETLLRNMGMAGFDKPYGVGVSARRLMLEAYCRGLLELLK